MVVPSYVPTLTLVQILIPMVINAVSIYAFARVLHVQIRRVGARNISPTLTVYVLAWISTLVGLYPSEVNGLVNWRPTPGLRDTWRTIVYGMLFIPVSSSVPVSVFWLSVDRLLTLHFLHAYTTRHQRWFAFLAGGCVLAIIAYMLAMFGSYIASIYATAPQLTPCSSFGCLTAPVWDNYIGAKAAFGFVNLCTGALLILKIWTMAGEARAQLANEQAGRKYRSANIIAVAAVCTELLFNFIPQAIVVVLTWVRKVGGTRTPPSY